MNPVTLFLLLLCPFCFALNNIALRLYQTKVTDDTHSLLLFQASFCFLASLLYATGVRSIPSPPTIVLAVAFGCCFFLCSLCGARCYLVGPMSLTSVIINSSMFLPILWSVLFWNDSLTGRMIVGIVLVLLTFVLSSLSSGKPQEHKEHFNKKWLLLVSAAFLCNGTSAILQKTRQRAEPQGDLFVFLAISYLTAALLFCLSYLLQKGKYPPLPSTNIHRPLWWMLVAMAGLGTFLGNCLLQILCTQVTAGVLYPVVNGGLCILTAATSFVFFREQATIFKLCSIAVGVLGIVLLSL